MFLIHTNIPRFENNFVLLIYMYSFIHFFSMLQVYCTVLQIRAWIALNANAHGETAMPFWKSVTGLCVCDMFIITPFIPTLNVSETTNSADAGSMCSVS